MDYNFAAKFLLGVSLLSLLYIAEVMDGIFPFKKDAILKSCIVVCAIALVMFGSLIYIASHGGI